MAEKKSLRGEFQKLIDEAMNIQGQIRFIDQEIEKYQNYLMRDGWSEGNIKIGWNLGDNFSSRMFTPISNRDRMFSLSSVTSQASQHLDPIQNQKTAPNDGVRFFKKKKSKKKNNRSNSRIAQCRNSKSSKRKGRPRKLIHH